MPSLHKPSRKLLIRATAMGGLLLFFAAVAGIVVAGPPREALAPADVRFIHARLLDLDQGVRTKLVRIQPDSGLTDAQRETRAAIEGANALQRAVRGAGGPSARLLQVAIGNELRFLDATGSVLVNPRSRLLADLPALDLAARRSLAAIDGPRQRRTGGVTALQRLRRDSAPAPEASPA
jgi:hypothetical protein